MTDDLLCKILSQLVDIENVLRIGLQVRECPKCSTLHLLKNMAIGNDSDYLCCACKCREQEEAAT